MRLGTSMTSASLFALALGCAPKAEQGECSAVDPCPRGQECDLEVSMCLDIEVDTHATEDPAPSNFTNKTVPFFRGQVCTVHEVQAGATFPVRMVPCLHPCVQASSFKFKHSWSCVGADCEAFGVMWMNTSSTAGGCPADAFGRFDRSMCVDGPAIEFDIRAVLADDSPVQGGMVLEVPFISNDDAAAIAANPDDLDQIQEIIARYPQDPSRVVGSKPISLLAGNPAPPETCGESGENCDCYDVGF